jgi:hypothetical protein
VVVGAAVTGSDAAGASDRWSDIDLAFAVDGELGPVLERWTGTLYASSRHRLVGAFPRDVLRQGRHAPLEGR